MNFHHRECQIILSGVKKKCFAYHTIHLFYSFPPSKKNAQVTPIIIYYMYMYVYVCFVVTVVKQID